MEIIENKYYNLKLDEKTVDFKTTEIDIFRINKSIDSSTQNITSFVDEYFIVLNKNYDNKYKISSNVYQSLIKNLNLNCKNGFKIDDFIILDNSEVEFEINTNAINTKQEEIHLKIIKTDNCILIDEKIYNCIKGI